MLRSVHSQFSHTRILIFKFFLLLTPCLQVYKAQHRGGEMYAMKVISREKIGSIKLQENLDSEISIMRDYRHENIVQLYDHFVSRLLLLTPCHILPSPLTFVLSLPSLPLFCRPPHDTSISSWNIVLAVIYKNLLKRMRDSLRV